MLKCCVIKFAKLKSSLSDENFNKTNMPEERLENPVGI